MRSRRRCAPRAGRVVLPLEERSLFRGTQSGTGWDNERRTRRLDGDPAPHRRVRAGPRRCGRRRPVRRRPSRLRLRRRSVVGRYADRCVMRSTSRLSAGGQFVHHCRTRRDRRWCVAAAEDHPDALRKARSGVAPSTNAALDVLVSRREACRFGPRGPRALPSPPEPRRSVGVDRVRRPAVRSSVGGALGSFLDRSSHDANRLRDRRLRTLLRASSRPGRALRTNRPRVETALTRSRGTPPRTDGIGRHSRVVDPVTGGPPVGVGRGDPHHDLMSTSRSGRSSGIDTCPPV